MNSFSYMKILFDFIRYLYVMKLKRAPTLLLPSLDNDDTEDNDERSFKNKNRKKEGSKNDKNETNATEILDNNYHIVINCEILVSIAGRNVETI